MLKIWLNLGLNITIFLGTGPRPLIEVRLNFFIPQFKYMKFIHSYFEKGVSEKAHATIPKGIVGGFQFTINCSKKFERMARETMDGMFTSAKEKHQSRFDSYIVRNSVTITSHISLRDCRVHIFSEDFLFLKQLYSSLIFPGRITNQ